MELQTHMNTNDETVEEDGWTKFVWEFVALVYERLNHVYIRLVHVYERDKSSYGIFRMIPLMRSVEGSHAGAEKALLQHGCDVDREDMFGESALHYSAESGNEERTQMLLQAGADDNVQSASINRTPLMLAVKGSHTKVVKVLLQHGCDVDREDLLGKTAFDYSAKSSNVKIRNILLQAEPKLLWRYIIRKLQCGEDTSKGTTNDDKLPSDMLKESWIKKMRMNYSSVIQIFSKNIISLVDIFFYHRHIDMSEVNNILSFETNKDKSRKFFDILINKNNNEWLTTLLNFLQQNKDGKYLYEMINRTDEYLGFLSQAELGAKLQETTVESAKYHILRESIRQNRSYLANQLSRTTAGDVNLRMFTASELEYITTRDDYRSKVEAALMCLLGRQDSGWVLPFTQFISSHLGKKSMSVVFGSDWSNINM